MSLGSWHRAEGLAFSLDIAFLPIAKARQSSMLIYMSMISTLIVALRGCYSSVRL